MTLQLNFSFTRPLQCKNNHQLKEAILQFVCHLCDFAIDSKMLTCSHAAKDSNQWKENYEGSIFDAKVYFPQNEGSVIYLF